MPLWISQAAAAFLGFSSGVVIAGAVFAFIAIIGIVPRLAQKTNTEAYAKLYEEAIIIGGVFGASMVAFDYSMPAPKLIVIFLSLCTGIFFGVLAMSLAEVLNVIPVLARRARIQKGMFFFVLACAVGKLVGSLLYFIVPGFYSN